MYLLIDPSARDLIHLALFDEDTIKRYECAGRNRELLMTIDLFLSQEGVPKDNLKGIMAVIGAGSFTSTRIAAVIANVFGYVQGLPLLAVTKEQASKPQALIPALAKQPVRQYVSATYSGEPNIGKVEVDAELLTRRG